MGMVRWAVSLGSTPSTAGWPADAQQTSTHARVRACAWFVLACLNCVCVQHAAANAAQHITLHYVTPVSCAERADLVHAVDVQLGTGFITDTRLRADVQVIAHGAGDYELIVQYTTDSGAHDQRRIHGESCEAAMDAAALVLALALQPKDLGTPAEAPPKSVEAPDLGWAAGAAVQVDTAATSALIVGAALRFEMSLGALRLNISVADFLAHDREHAGVDTRLQLWSADVGACYVVPLQFLRLGPCGHFELGHLAGKARGNLEAASAGSARLQAARLGTALRAQLFGPIWLAFDADLEWIARRPQFIATGIGTLSRSAPFGVRIGLGPLLIW
jgi:hypothetical protein